MTNSRIRRQFDQGRMGQLVAAPGVDTRTWIAIARVDDDEDAIRWEDPDGDAGPLGWLVDVTVQGGPLDQEPISGCRVGSAFQGKIDPIKSGVLVVVAVSEGNPNAEPTIVGILNSPGCEPPSEVNGTTIDEAYAAATHILVTPHAIDQQVAENIRIKTAKKHRLLGDTVELATEDATQAFVRGNAQKDALNTFLTTLNTWAGQVATGITSGGGVEPPTQAAFLTAIGQLQTDLGNALSSKIKGE